MLIYFVTSNPLGDAFFEQVPEYQGCQLDCPDNRDPPIGQDCRDLAPDCVGTAGLQPVAEPCQASLSLVILRVGIGRS